MKRIAIPGIAAAFLATPALAGEWSPLIAPGALAPMIEAEEAVVLDIRSVKDYTAGHVPTAVNVPYHAWRGPEDNPGEPITDEKVTFLLQEAGIEPETPVVVTYAGEGTLDFGSAARVYWTLKSAGVEQIAILNGGLAAWKQAGEELEAGEWSNFPSETEFTLSAEWTIDRDGVEDVLSGAREAVLIDARPAQFFEGREKHKLARWAGTLAGALNLDHERLFSGGSVLNADPDAIRRIAAEAGWRKDGPEIVSFCNTGHWAATNWFALSEIAGIEGVKLYPESLVGWTNANSLAQGG